MPLPCWADPSRLRTVAPGLLLAATIAAASSFVASTYGGPVMLLALLFGMALNFLSESAKVEAGVRCAAKQVLRIGVALLGARIAVTDVVELGTEVLVAIPVLVAVTMFSGVLLARSLGHSSRLGILVGGATAICGASAALAIGSVLPREARPQGEVAFTIVIVTALSTVAMVAYPVLFIALGFGDRQTGILLGASIHDVAQVVGAGYAVSELAGDTATIVKLFRVVLLLPVVFILSLTYAALGEKHGTSGPVPGFALAFAMLVVFNSAELIPSFVQAPLADLSRGCLLMAIAAIGLTTSLKDVLNYNRRSVVLALATTLLLLGFALVVVALWI